MVYTSVSQSVVNEPSGVPKSIPVCRQPRTV